MDYMLYIISPLNETKITCRAFYIKYRRMQTSDCYIMFVLSSIGFHQSALFSYNVY